MRVAAGDVATALAYLERVANRTSHRQIGDGNRVASPRLSPVLDVEEPVEHASLGVYEYRGEHAWTNHGGKNARRFFYVGLWS